VKPWFIFDSLIFISGGSLYIYSYNTISTRSFSPGTLSTLRVFRVIRVSFALQCTLCQYVFNNLADDALFSLQHVASSSFQHVGFLSSRWLSFFKTCLVSYKCNALVTYKRTLNQCKKGVWSFASVVSLLMFSYAGVGMLLMQCSGVNSESSNTVNFDTMCATIGHFSFRHYASLFL
jgi:hypothetical protein